jgi:hypothetical protein
MEKFMLIVREDLGRLSRLTHEERFANTPIMLEWIRGLVESGNYVGGEPLAVTGCVVRQNEVQTDGPFIEAKECIAGYDIILAENLNQAVSIAQTCPLVMQGIAVREVRPIIAL